MLACPAIRFVEAHHFLLSHSSIIHSFAAIKQTAFYILIVLFQNVGRW